MRDSKNQNPDEAAKPARVRGLLLSIVVLLGAALAIFTTGPVGRGTSPVRPLSGEVLVSSNCGPATFCVSSPSPGPTIYPGATPKTLPISFTNPYNVPITITTLQVSFTNTFQPGCSSSDFQVGTTGATGSPPSVTIKLYDTIPAASTAAYSGASLGLADDGNQDGCKNQPLTLSYTATAIYDVNCLSGSQQGMTVGSGQVACISKSGKVIGSVTVKPGGVLLVNGGTITGGLTASSPVGINLCAAAISGGAAIFGAVGQVVIGDGTATCPGGTISGGLTVTNGTDGVQIINNTITGGLTVSGNTGSIPGPSGTGQFVSGNTITGGFICTPANSPALRNGGSPNTVKGTSTQCAGSF